MVGFNRTEFQNYISSMGKEYRRVSLRPLKMINVTYNEVDKVKINDSDSSIELTMVNQSPMKLIHSEKEKFTTIDFVSDARIIFDLIVKNIDFNRRLGIYKGKGMIRFVVEDRTRDEYYRNLVEVYNKLLKYTDNELILNRYNDLDKECFQLVQNFVKGKDIELYNELLKISNPEVFIDIYNGAAGIVNCICYENDDIFIYF